VHRLRAGQFWPPNENVRHDAFAEMFLGNVSRMVSPEVVSKLSGGL
jgi:hypothetical protein